MAKSIIHQYEDGEIRFADAVSFILKQSWSDSKKLEFITILNSI